MSLSVKYFGDAIHVRFEKIQEQLSELSAVAQETLAGVRVVRAYGQEANEIERFRAVNQAYLDRNRALIRLQGVFYPSMTFFLGLSALVVLWLGSREVILGRMTLGEFVAFNTYLGMLSWPMIAFGWVTNLLQRGTASWKRLLEILDTPPAIQDAPGAKPASEWGPLRGDIEFRDLTFAYAADAPPVLEHVSLSIAAGQTVAIIGATGSGKSTLDRPAAASSRSAAGHGVHRWRRRARHSAARAPRRDRHGAAGAVPVLGDRRREHRVRRAAACARAWRPDPAPRPSRRTSKPRASTPCWPPPKSRALIKTSTPSRKPGRQWSASAA